MADGALDVARVFLAPDLVADVGALGGVDLQDQFGRIGGNPRIAGARAALAGLHLEPVPAVGQALDAQAVLLAQQFR